MLLFEWTDKYREAHDFMESRRCMPDTLIEISAQHPLREGRYPNAEFERRLQEGIHLREQMIRTVRGTIWMLVPGSKHRTGAVTDEYSLSDAGREFLKKHGVPSDTILGEETIRQYKGENHAWPGVFNSADEAYVAASLFKDREEMGELISIVSVAQAMRKKLHYIWNGVLPEMASIRPKNGYHNPLREWMRSIPYTLFVDPDWQSPDSKPARKSRQERQPRTHN